MDASSENDDNGPNGPGTSASDGHEGVHFGWSDEIVDEDSYEAHEDSGESDWLGRDQLLSDNDEEVNTIGAHFMVVKKKIRNKIVQAADLEPPLNLSFVVENENDARNAEVENEANRNRPAESGVNEKEADGNGENKTDGADENYIEENEASSVGLSTGEETDYLGSSDVGSYETDKNGYFVSKKTSKGLLEEVQQCLPHVEHRYCARHIICKLKPKAYADLMEKDPSHWSKAFLSTRSKCDAIDNNFCEAFNSAIIVAREESLENYVLHLYKKEVYQELYSVVIPTIPSEKYWQDSGMGKIDPPLKRKLHGRPKHKRRKEEGKVKGKTKLRKLGAKIICRCRGLTGHNIRTCPKKQQANVQNHANQPPPMAAHPGPSSSIPSDPPPLIGSFSPPHSIGQSAPQPSTGPSSPPHSTIPSAPQPSTGPSSPPYSTLLSAPQPSTGPSSPPHSTIPSAPPMVFMPTPFVQPSLAFDSTSPPVTRITTLSPKRKVASNMIPLYRRSREHATPSTTVIPPISSQPTATVNVPQEGKERPPKLTIWKP
ncbi:hypothetical protein V6N13_129711 [Hibiscus sabdariffa]